MKVIQIISPGHSGSTILDIVLGSNDQLVSSGELRKLPWQVQRSVDGEVSIKRQNICTCLRSFDECDFWGKVLDNIASITGIDIKKSPEEFEISFFGEFGHYLHTKRPSIKQRAQGKVYRLLLQNNKLSRSVMRSNKTISKILDNNWMLFDQMSKVSGKQIIIDSSKDIKRALLLHNDKPEQVYFLFLNRDLNGHLSSLKRRNKSLKLKKSSEDILYDIVKFRKRVKRIISERDINYLDVNYEDVISDPLSFYDRLSELVGIDVSPDLNLARNSKVNTKKMHLVAGNPTRYKGEMYLKLDDRWKDELNDEDIKLTSKFYNRIQ